MSAEYLRETALKMRTDRAACSDRERRTELASARWLESVADNWDIARHGSWSLHALAVAHAWRGDQ